MRLFKSFENLPSGYENLPRNEKVEKNSEKEEAKKLVTKSETFEN